MSYSGFHTKWNNHSSDRPQLSGCRPSKLLHHQQCRILSSTNIQSGAEPWVPARRVWNQHGYFNVNVNDNLTIPKIQQKHHLVFSENVCTAGKNRPLNSFLNQSPYLNSLGCPKYASPDWRTFKIPLQFNLLLPGSRFQDFISDHQSRRRFAQRNRADYILQRGPHECRCDKTEYDKCFPEYF